MSASSTGTAFIKDYSEKRRIGTLAVFVDNGFERDTPLIAIPINLATALKLPKDVAYLVRRSRSYTHSNDSKPAPHVGIHFIHR